MRAIASAVDAEIRAWRGALHALAESADLRNGRLGEFAAAARAVAARYNGWIVAIDASGQQVVNTLLPAGGPPCRRRPRATWWRRSSGTAGR